MNVSRAIRFAILGCGAVTELCHLPAFSRVQDACVSLLVDINEERCKQLAAKYNVEHTTMDVEGCYNLFDAAIIALPHALHASIAVKLLAQGKSVLVEKPMAFSVAECDAMIKAAEQNAATLAVGLMRHFIWSHRWAYHFINSGALGRIKSFDFREGSIYSWPVASDFFFKKETAGGGVLIDTGAHTLDCLVHWLGEFSDVQYFDDANGGIEADCLLNIQLKNGASGVVELSRTRRLRNTAIIRGERGTIEIWLNSNELKLTVADQPYVFGGVVSNPREPNKEQGDVELMTSQIEDFIAAIKSGRQPEVNGQLARASIRLIESCYRNRMPLPMPWIAPDLQNEQLSANG
jgi:predicted dehydrogenase